MARDNTWPPLPDEPLPSSPPSPSLSAPLSPTSSEPMVFSSDESLEAEDVTNYESPRLKRKRKGTWWDDEAPPLKRKREGTWWDDENTEETFVVKKTQLARNYSTGIFMMYDEPFTQTQARIDRQTQHMDTKQALFFRRIAGDVQKDRTLYDYDHMNIEDLDLQHIILLNQVIQAPLDPGREIPAEGQYHSMVPELFLYLGSNRLHRLTPNLFNIQHLTYLSLRSNNIEALPPQIAQLQNLKALDLRWNQLSTLPHELQFLLPPLGRLERLSIAGNPLLETVSRSALREEWEQLVPSNANYNQGLVDHLLNIYGEYSSEYTIWAVAFIESWIVDWKGYGTFSETKRALIGCTPVVYYDQSGRLLAGSPTPAKVGEPFDVLVPTSRGVFPAPAEAYFQPPVESGVPSLFTLALNRALTEERPAQIQRLLGEETPKLVDLGLERARENVLTQYSPVRTCRCGKKYVVARAEWVEYWANAAAAEVVPFKSMVCSWKCADELHLRSYLDTDVVANPWVDRQGRLRE